MMTRLPARDLYQSRLDPMTQAIMAGDVDRFVGGLCLPHLLRTIDTSVVFDNIEDLRQEVSKYIWALHDLGLTGLVRRCESAVYLKDDVIEGYNSVRALAGQEEAMIPFLARMRLEQRDGEWLFSEVDMAVLRSAFTALPGNAEAIKPLPDAPVGDHEFQMACFQVVLNWLSQATISNDFASWRRAIHLPLVVTTPRGETVFHREDALRLEFDLYMKAFEVHKVTDLIRKAIDLQVLSEDRIVGTCRTYLMRHAELVLPVYDSTVTLERNSDGLWQLARMDNAMGHRDWSAR